MQRYRPLILLKQIPWILPLVLAGCMAPTEPVAEGGYPPAERWEEAVKAFEAADLDSPPLAGAILCIGSSSMRMWHPTIEEDLAPLTLIKRGFGGSTMLDVLHYADRIVLPYKPRAILLYEGDNDVAAGVPPGTIFHTWQAFVSKVHAALPTCRIYFISIKPSIDRWKLWPQMEEANRLIAESCDLDRRLTYIDVASPMLNEEGTPRPEIFVEDQLHMNSGGYETWRDVLRPVLIGAELPYEARMEPLR